MNLRVAGSASSGPRAVEQPGHETAGDGVVAMTLRRALELPCLRRGLPDVLAGEEDLDRPVRWVHVTEDPHVGHTLKGGELMLTTGMALHVDRRDTLAFITDLTERGSAGLVIELSNPMPKVPEWLIEHARRAGLPVVCLRREVAFVEVTEALHSEILAHQLAIFRQGQEVHDRLAAVAVEGKGIGEILAELAEIVANPVVLEDHRGGLLFHASHGLDDRDVVAAWEADREGSRSAAALEVPVPRSGTTLGGRLIVYPLESPVDEFDRTAADRAAGIISISLVRNHEDQIVAARERGNFLIELIDQRLTAREAAMRAQALGFAGAAPTLLPCAVSLNMSGRGPDADFWYALRRELDADGHTSLVASHPHVAEIVIVVALKRPERRQAAADRVAALVHGVASRRTNANSAVIAVGDSCTWEGLAEQLVEAARILEAARALPARPWHDAALPELERLLWSLGQVPDVQRFALKTLAPLIEQDKRRNSALLETLQAFCECGGRKTAAADVLHLRRQALHYRLSRIEEVLDADLSDEDTRLGLHLALRVKRYVDAQPASRPV